MDSSRSNGAISKLLVSLVLVVAAAWCAAMLCTSQASAQQLQGYTLKVQDTSEIIHGADGVDYEVWFSNGAAASVSINGFTSGSKDTLVIPSSIVDRSTGKKIPINQSGTYVFIKEGAFKGKPIKSVVIPSHVNSIGKEAFAQCTGLQTVVIEGSTGLIDEWKGLSIGDNAFADCSGVKEYYLGKNMTPSTVSGLDKSSIGKTSLSGTVYSGATIIVAPGSRAEAYANSAAITKRANSDPYKAGLAKVNVDPAAPSNPGTPTAATPYSKGATEAALNAAITKYAGESDPKGTVFSALKAKASSVKKDSIKLSWSKVKGAKRYVVYANKCNNKMKKLTTTKKASVAVKKAGGKKLVKGTYYKFIVAAIDKNGKVISTSKMTHVATSGGKVGNAKSVKTAAKKNKVKFKKGRTFKLNAKEVAQSKKLKIKKHRKTSFESTDTNIATVSSKGVIKGVKSGKCIVYAYAQNGVCTKIKVTVK